MAKIGISITGSRFRHQQGFTYLMVLAALIIVGILAESASLLNSRLVKADREQELLFRGQAYRNAIASYYYTSPVRRYPRRLEVLLNDPRFLHKRHIRQLYTDPVGKADWLLLKNSRGGITGVTSASQATPLKQANFQEALQNFAGAERYRDWIFEFRPVKTKKKVNK